MIWTALELIFLFFFFKLPPVDNFIKSKYEQHLEHSQQVQNSGHVKQNEVDKKYDKVNGQYSKCDPSLSTSEEEKAPLLTSGANNDIQVPTMMVTPLSSKSFLQRGYWLLNG